LAVSSWTKAAAKSNEIPTQKKAISTILTAFIGTPEMIGPRAADPGVAGKIPSPPGERFGRPPLSYLN
jgi:hypothetical protein